MNTTKSLVGSLAFAHAALNASRLGLFMRSTA